MYNKGPYQVVRLAGWSRSFLLREHRYLNKLKLLSPKTENFQIKNSDIFFTKVKLLWFLFSTFRFSLSFFAFVFRFSFFDIRTEAERRRLTFKILFWHSHWSWISYFDIRKPVSNWHSNWGRYVASFLFVFRFFFFFFFFFLFFVSRFSFFAVRFRFSTFKLMRKIKVWHSKSYFDIHFEEYSILTFGTLFDIRIKAKYHILTFKKISWHSNWSRKSYIDILNRIFDIWTKAEYRILTFWILFWHVN